jgi:hypothetical protein
MRILGFARAISARIFHLMNFRKTLISHSYFPTGHKMPHNVERNRFLSSSIAGGGFPRPCWGLVVHSKSEFRELPTTSRPDENGLSASQARVAPTSTFRRESGGDI